MTRKLESESASASIAGGFNGAASRMTRKLRRKNQAEISLVSFNGAASRMTRKLAAHACAYLASSCAPEIERFPHISLALSRVFTLNPCYLLYLQIVRAAPGISGSHSRSQGNYPINMLVSDNHNPLRGAIGEPNVVKTLADIECIIS